MYDAAFVQRLVDRLRHVAGVKAVVLGGSYFALQNARKSAKRGDVYFVAGCITRIVSDLVHTLYALNETYFISNKRLYQDAERFVVNWVKSAQLLRRNGHASVRRVEIDHPGPEEIAPKAD